jgi:hypothetical protein
MSHVRTTPPRPAETLPKPAETNTSRTDKTLWKNLAGAFTLLQDFGGYTRGYASAPPRNSTATRREESPISKRQPLQVPNGYHYRGSGATAGDNHKGPLISGENTPFKKIIKCKQTNPQISKRAPRGRDLEQRRAHGPRSLNSPPNGQPQYPSGEFSSLSRTRAPLRGVSASFEGLTPP